jgi:hypothetical protein
MIDLGLLHYFLGLQVWHMTYGIFLYWPKYSLDFLDLFHLSDCNPSPTPFKFGVKIIIDCGSPLVDATLYHQLDGSLIYLTHSKIDLSNFFVSMVPRFMKKPHENHWKEAKRILIYLQGTLHYGVSIQARLLFHFLVTLIQIEKEILLK